MADKNIANSFAWKFLERAGTQIVNLIIQIVLARLIAPSEFGSLVVLSVFVNIANIFIQKGLSSSIVRKKEADYLDYDTALWASIAMATILYVIMFLVAPLIARVYESSVLTMGLRVFSIQLFFGALYSIQNAILVREMRFKSVFIRGMVSSVGSGIVGVIMAYLGFGLWALVAQTVLNQVLYCVTAWNSISWKPKFHFSKERLNEILSFGGKILISELLSYSVEGIRTLAIGKVYSTEALSFYDRGQTYPATLMRGIYDTLGGVLLPAFSRKQDDDEQLGAAVIKSCSLAFFLTTPIFVGMAAVADPLIRILLTDKWAGAIPFFAIFSLYWIPYPIQGICKNGVYAKGVSDSVLKIEIAKTIITFVTLGVTLFISPSAIAIAALITMVLITVLYIIALYKLIRFSIRDLINGLIKPTINSGIMFIVVSFVGMIDINNYVKLFMQVGFGMGVYIVTAFLMRDSSLTDCVKVLKSIKNK